MLFTTGLKLQPTDDFYDLALASDSDCVKNNCLWKTSFEPYFLSTVIAHNDQRFTFEERERRLRPDLVIMTLIREIMRDHAERMDTRNGLLELLDMSS